MPLPQRLFAQEMLDVLCLWNLLELPLPHPGPSRPSSSLPLVFVSQFSGPSSKPGFPHGFRQERALPWAQSPSLCLLAGSCLSLHVSDSWGREPGVGMTIRSIRACGTKKELAVSALLEEANNKGTSQCRVRFGLGLTGAPTGKKSRGRKVRFGGVSASRRCVRTPAPCVPAAPLNFQRISRWLSGVTSSSGTRRAPVQDEHAGREA